MGGRPRDRFPKCGLHLRMVLDHLLPGTFTLSLVRGLISLQYPRSGASGSIATDRVTQVDLKVTKVKQRKSTNTASVLGQNEWLDYDSPTRLTSMAFYYSFIPYDSYRSEEALRSWQYARQWLTVKANSRYIVMSSEVYKDKCSCTITPGQRLSPWIPGKG